MSIGESVKTIGEQAFYNCVNLETIFNYRPTPTNTYSNAFDGVDKFECKLYVLPSSIDMYKAAAVWRDFYYTYAIGAEEATVTTNDVQVEPQDNAAINVSQKHRLHSNTKETALPVRFSFTSLRSV